MASWNVVQNLFSRTSFACWRSSIRFCSMRRYSIRSSSLMRERICSSRFISILRLERKFGEKIRGTDAHLWSGIFPVVRRNPSSKSSSSFSSSASFGEDLFVFWGVTEFVSVIGSFTVGSFAFQYLKFPAQQIQFSPHQK
mgnify:CR=1 FL=1